MPQAISIPCMVTNHQIKKDIYKCVYVYCTVHALSYFITNPFEKTMEECLIFFLYNCFMYFNFPKPFYCIK